MREKEPVNGFSPESLSISKAIETKTAPSRDHNRKIAESLLDDFLLEPTTILFVNDVSIHLQRGEINRLWRAFEAAETVVVNGYYGERLKADCERGLSSCERTLMEELASRMDRVIRL
jgi:hypothetical protein